jgi:hypothetical protein
MLGSLCIMHSCVEWLRALKRHAVCQYVCEGAPAAASRCTGLYRRIEKVKVLLRCWDCHQVPFCM